MVEETETSGSTNGPGGVDEGGTGGGGGVVKKETMTEYCTKLEAWLWQAYYQRSVATSAYFTALSNAQQFFSHAQYPHPHPLPHPGGMDPNLNNNNYYPPPMGQGGQEQGQGQPPPPQAGGGARVIFNNNIPPAQRQPLLMFMAAAGLGPRPGMNVVTTSTTVSTAVVVKLAPVWKRFLAEVIDFLFLLIIKLFITFTVIDTFELIDLDNIDLDALRDGGAGGAGGGTEGDAQEQLQSLYDLALSLTSELLLLELTHRIVVCFFEAYCLWKVGGTPGKTMLRLRVIHAADILPFTPPPQNNNQGGGGGQGGQGPFGWDMGMGGGPSVIVRPGNFLTFPRAFLRSCLKNFSLAFFFPLCFTLFHFDNSRTLYDLMAHSLVIEM